MPRIIHFELFADSVDRAVRFYTKVFDWNLKQDETAPAEYWLATPKEKEPSVTAGITERTYPEDSTVITYEVTSVDGFAQRIIDAGGKVYSEEPTILPGIG